MRVTTLRFDRESGWSGPLPDVEPDRSLTLCFGAPGYLNDTDPLRDLALGTGGNLLGCSTSGEIHHHEVADDTLSVAVMEFETTTVRSVAERITLDGSFSAGIAIGQRLADPSLKAIFILSEGLDVNGSELVRGINSVVPVDVVVTGGLAGDGPRFQQTWVIVDGKPVSGYVTAAGLYGNNVRVGHGSKGGWDKFGPERTVTRSRGNIVYELDGRPILELYREYLGDLAGELPASGSLFPLALRQPGSEKQLVRTIIGVDEAEQSLTFAGDVTQGHQVQLMHANFHRLIDGAEDAAASAIGRAAQVASVSIAVSCVGRRLVLGERTEDELEAMLHLLPSGTPQVGFYSYGEISPYTDGFCDLHNQTMTLTTIGEVV